MPTTMLRLRRRWLFLGVLLSGLLLGCALVGSRSGAISSPTPIASLLHGGVLATFDVDGERFRVWVTNPTTISQLLALQEGSSAAGIPNGLLLPGPGEGDHNAPWSWHLDPQDVEMAEVTVEVCDGRPSYVEEHLDEFIQTVGRYCPWGAELIGLEDLRE